MANVTEVGVRFMRRVQVKDYEPLEVEMSLKAQLADDEDHVVAGSKLVADARTMVREGITGKVEEKVVEVEKPVTEKKKPGRPRKEIVTEPPVYTKTEEVPEAPVEAPKTEDSPTEPPVDAKTEEVPEAPVDVPTDEPVSVGFTPDDLYAYVAEVVRAKKIDAAGVREILAGFGAARTLDVKPENTIRVKELIEATFATVEAPVDI